MIVANGINLSTFHPNDGDVIVLTYDKELVTPTQFMDIFDLAREEFPNNQVIAVPMGMTVSTK